MPAKPRFLRLGGPWLWRLVPLILTALVFYGIQGDFFTNWDDTEYVVNNPLIKSLDLRNILHIFSPKSLVSGQYQPVTILSYAINYAMGALDPRGYIAANILLHLFNVLLVFIFFRKFSGNDRIAGICAVLFGIHPLHVESVAWITGRKDVLYALFFLSAMICYLAYGEKKGASRAVAYGLTWILFVLSLLSKSAAVILPAIMLLIDYYQGRRFSVRIVAEKIPFLIPAVIVGILAIHGQAGNGSLEGNALVPLQGKIIIAAYSFMFYWAKFFLPIHLSSFYAYPMTVHPSTWSLWYKLSLPGVLAIAGLAFRFRRDRATVFGFLFFLVSIIFLLHFVPVGSTITADRFTYIPYIGLFFIGAFYFEKLIAGATRNPRTRILLTAGGVVIIAILCFIARDRCTVWRDSITLWSDVIEKDGDKTRAALTGYTNRGAEYMNRGQFDRAFDDIHRVIVSGQADENACGSYGVIFRNLGNDDSAIVYLTKAITMNPAREDFYLERGLAFGMKGLLDPARADFTRAVALNPHDARAFDNLGMADELLGFHDLAIEYFRKALDLDPGSIRAMDNLQRALAKMQQSK
jgi:tetratricopeptide (TPR) repeat protein